MMVGSPKHHSDDALEMLPVHVNTGSLRDVSRSCQFSPSTSWKPVTSIVCVPLTVIVPRHVPTPPPFGQPTTRDHNTCSGNFSCASVAVASEGRDGEDAPDGDHRCSECDDDPPW